MGYINSVKILFEKYKYEIKDNVKTFVAKVFNIKENNLTQAIDFIEVGMLDEGFNRLRIILTLWPNNENAKYLMGLIYIFMRENEKAIKYLKDIEYYKIDYIEKLINLAENNKTERVIEAYKKNFSLYDVEGEVYEM